MRQTKNVWAGKKFETLLFARLGTAWRQHGVLRKLNLVADQVRTGYGSLIVQYQQQIVIMDMKERPDDVTNGRKAI